MSRVCVYTFGLSQFQFQYALYLTFTDMPRQDHKMRVTDIFIMQRCSCPLLYGSENWILTDGLLEKLETLQAELVKRVLKLPKHHSNTAAITTFDVPSMKCRVLVRKLGFLRRIKASDQNSLGKSVLFALCGEVVRECREIEDHFGTHFTNVIMNGETFSSKEMKKTLVDRDKKIRMKRCVEKAPMIAMIAESPGWARLWDNALDLGWKAVLGLKMLSRAMSHHGRGEHPCHLCDETSPL